MQCIKSIWKCKLDISMMFLSQSIIQSFFHSPRFLQSYDFSWRDWHKEEMLESHWKVSTKWKKEAQIQRAKYLRAGNKRNEFYECVKFPSVRTFYFSIPGRIFDADSVTFDYSTSNTFFLFFAILSKFLTTFPGADVWIFFSRVFREGSSSCEFSRPFKKLHMYGESVLGVRLSRTIH